MASSAEVTEVRQNINEADADPFDDVLIGTIIDESGVTGASAILWRRKAARYAELVNVSEAGASHSFSDLHKNALTMAEKYEALVIVATTAGPRVSVIERE